MGLLGSPMQLINRLQEMEAMRTSIESRALIIQTDLYNKVALKDLNVLQLSSYS